MLDEHKANRGRGEKAQRDARGRFLAGHTPPGARPWRPGQSGNPRGRRSGQGLGEELARQLQRTADTLPAFASEARKAGLDPATVTVRQAVVWAALQQAVDGDMTVLVELFNRIDGKVADRLAAHDGGPLSGFVDTMLAAVLLDEGGMTIAAALAQRVAVGEEADRRE